MSEQANPNAIFTADVGTPTFGLQDIWT